MRPFEDGLTASFLDPELLFSDSGAALRINDTFDRSASFQELLLGETREENRLWFLLLLARLQLWLRRLRLRNLFLLGSHCLQRELTALKQILPLADQEAFLQFLRYRLPKYCAGCMLPRSTLRAQE